MLGQKSSEHVGLVPGGPPTRTPELPLLMHRLNEAVSEAEGVLAVIHQALGRLHGPIPTPDTDIEATKDVSDSVTFALERQVARMGRVLGELRSARDRLNSIV